MSDETKQLIGPYTLGEIPESLQITMLGGDGSALNLTGYTGTFRIKNIDTGTVVTGSGSASIPTPASGITQYDWAAADLNTVGTFHAQMWADDGSQRFASEVFIYCVTSPTTYS